MNSLRAMLVCVAVILGIALWVCGSGSGAPAGSNPLLDTSKPDTWKAAVVKAQGDLDQIGLELMTIAKDDKAPREDRRLAVTLLGELGTRPSLEFLVDNVTLALPLEARRGDEDYARGFPCMYALRTTGWGGAEAIMKSLGRTRSGEELMLLTTAIRRILGPSLAMAVVDDAISNTRDAIRTRNLTAMKTHLMG
jgi:hypothetical protein